MIKSIDQLDFDEKYTYADYQNWQFEERVELINGYIYPMERSGEQSINLSAELCFSK